MPILLLIKSISLLSFILLLIYGCFLLIKKRALYQAKKDIKIHLIEHKQISQKLSISLMKIEDEYLVVATNQNAIALERLSHKQTMKIKTQAPSASLLRFKE